MQSDQEFWDAYEEVFSCLFPILKIGLYVMLARDGYTFSYHKCHCLYNCKIHRLNDIIVLTGMLFKLNASISGP